MRADLSPFEPDGQSFLQASRNMMLLDGRFVTRPGVARVNEALHGLVGRPNAVLQYNAQGEENRIVATTASGMMHFDQLALQWVDVTEPGNELTGGIHAQMRVFEYFGVPWVIVVNGADHPKCWDGATATYGDVGGSPPHGSCIAVASNRVVIGSGLELYVSGINNFNAWYDQLIRLADTPGDLVTLMELGALSFVAYKEDAIYLISATPSAAAPFRGDLKAAWIPGPVSPAALCSLPDGSHCYLGRDGAVYVFNGVAPQSMGRAIQAYINQTADFNRIDRTFVFWDHDYKQLWICYVGLGSEWPNLALIIQYPEMTVWPQVWQDLRFTAGKQLQLYHSTRIGEVSARCGDVELTFGDFATRWSNIMLLSYDSVAGGGDSYQLDGTTDDGSPIAWEWETGFSNLGDPRYKTVLTVDHLVAQTAIAQSMMARLGVSDNGEARTLTEERTLALESARRKRSAHRATGRWFSLVCSGYASKEVQWAGASAHVEIRGER